MLPMKQSNSFLCKHTHYVHLMCDILVNAVRGFQSFSIQNNNNVLQGRFNKSSPSWLVLWEHLSLWPPDSAAPPSGGGGGGGGGTHLDYIIVILLFIKRLSSLWRLKCTGIIEKGPQSVSFIERFFSNVLYQKFYCTKIYFLQYFMHLAHMLVTARCSCASHLGT